MISTWKLSITPSPTSEEERELETMLYKTPEQGNSVIFQVGEHITSKCWEGDGGRSEGWKRVLLPEPCSVPAPFGCSWVVSFIINQ